MPSKRERELLLALRAHERDGTQFTLESLASVTGYALNSLKAYYTKKLKNFIVFRTDSGEFKACGLTYLSDDQYFTHMSQKSPSVGGHLANALAARLVERSFAAFVLAVEVYNRPSLHNRVESFAIMIVNAWELLLKAHLVENEGESSIYYVNSTRTLSLRDALKRTFPENDPIRHNLEQLEAIRDDAVHLLIPPLQPQFSRLFQASVLNFVSHAETAAGRHPLSGENPGLLSLVMEGPPVDLGTIKRDYGETTANRAKNFIETFEARENSVNSERFSVSVLYKLVLTKTAGEADLALTTNAQGARPALVLHQPKDIEKLFPLRSTDVVARLRVQLPDAPINSHTFQAIIFKNKIREDAQLHYRVEVANMSLFSEKVVDLIVQKARLPDWLRNARNSYAAHLREQRERRKMRKDGK